jgi:hypothetical protein
VAQSSAAAASMAAAAAREAGNRSAPGSFPTTAGSPFGGVNDFPLYNPPPSAADFPIFGPASPVGVSSRGGGSSGGRGGSSASAARAAETAEIRAQQDAIRDGIREVAKAQQEVQRENERTAATFSDMFVDAVTGARSLEESLNGIATSLAKLVVQRGFEQILNSGALGGFGTFLNGARAGGGPVTAGGAYLVGERGPEVFVPKMSGTIVPNKSSGGTPVAGGGDVTVQVFNAPAGTTVQETRGGDGGRVIKVMVKQQIEALMSEGSLDRTMASNFGIRRRAG